MPSASCAPTLQPAPGLRDHAAFSRAYGQHARSVHAAAMRVLNDHARAQDVVQDVFLRLWRRPEAFDMRRGALGPYLRVMARSRALDVLREGRATDRVGDRLRLATERLEPAVDAPLAPERHDLRRAVRGLPDGQREAVVLTYWAGLTAEEVARHADVPLGTAKSRVRLGVRRLRATYAADAAAA
jgi:RNA polymerase sigma-70 factor, ECF subfamily